MIIYFADGDIMNDVMYSTNDRDKEMIKVDAGMGYSYCRRKLRWIDENFPFDTEVFTNSLDAFSNFWCWNEEKKTPMIYIRNEDGKWTLISELTDRELRRGLVLAKLYANGEFCDVAT
jgi:hypothetical protein